MPTQTPAPDTTEKALNWFYALDPEATTTAVYTVQHHGIELAVVLLLLATLYLIRNPTFFKPWIS